MVRAHRRLWTALAIVGLMTALFLAGAWVGRLDAGPAPEVSMISSDVTATHLVWKSPRGAPFVPSPPADPDVG